RGEEPEGRLNSLDLAPSGVEVRSALQVINVCGDEQMPDQDDTFLIRLDPSGTFIQIYVNGVLEFTAAKDDVTQINVFGAGGNDNLIVDSSNGTVAVPGGINYDGDNPCPGQIGAGTGGIDRLTVTASPATPAIRRATYPLPAS